MVETRVRLTSEQAGQLRRFAESHRLSEAEVVARALDVLFRLADADATAERGDWMTLSEQALGKVWDNDADAAYDNWRELYGLPAR